jgi:hypothetical protein
MARLINCNTLGSSDGLIAIDLINCNTLGSSDGNILAGSSNRRMDGSFVD